ncbi:hypothetical protein C0581_00815 [Candidatus Parcubacteria bacterium]|nr:MAG: hypothetical protein C0581_00815 [Candidatus Parcubacteria bacterium]
MLLSRRDKSRLYFLSFPPSERPFIHVRRAYWSPGGGCAAVGALALCDDGGPAVVLVRVLRLHGEEALARLMLVNLQKGVREARGGFDDDRHDSGVDADLVEAELHERLALRLSVRVENGRAEQDILREFGVHRRDRLVQGRRRGDGGGDEGDEGDEDGERTHVITPCDTLGDVWQAAKLALLFVPTSQVLDHGMSYIVRRSMIQTFHHHLAL